MKLAAVGGAPVTTEPWPAWPRCGQRTLERLRVVLEGGRWAISGNWTGALPQDLEFCRQFSSYLGCRYSFTVDHGSSALLASLLALGVQPSQEVIVPGLTWVACASSVLRANAVPVLVDISPDTLCLAPDAVEAAITPRTAAIMVVHLYSAMADMECLGEIAARHGLPIIEDAAQAHGAVWDGKRAGSLGDVGTFSMQQGKVMTSGEGGVVVTSDQLLARRVEQIRSDGRFYGSSTPRLGQPHLEEGGEIQGFNFCLSEFQAALLLDGLERLDEENRQRAENARRLDRLLECVDGLELIRPHAMNTSRTYYHYVIRYRPEAFAGSNVRQVCTALQAELGTWVHPTYPPLDVHPLLQPFRYSSLVGSVRAQLSALPVSLPECHRQAERCVLLHHSVLLADGRRMEAIAEAFAKIRRHAGVVAGIPVPR